MFLFQDDVSVISFTPKEQLESRTVRIFSPSKNCMQSGTFGTHKWQIQFDTRDRWENALMGWTSTYVHCYVFTYHTTLTSSKFSKEILGCLS